MPQNADAARVVFTEIRLPRAVLGLLVGAALGLSGAVLQGYLRNPLAEPGSARHLGWRGARRRRGDPFRHCRALCIGAADRRARTVRAAAAIAIVALAGCSGTTTTLILAGVAVSAITAALTTLALNCRPTHSLRLRSWSG